MRKESEDTIAEMPRGGQGHELCTLLPCWASVGEILGPSVLLRLLDPVCPSDPHWCLSPTSRKNKVLPACIFSCCAHLGKGPFTWSSTLLNKDSIFRLLPFPDPTK